MHGETVFGVFYTGKLLVGRALVHEVVAGFFPVPGLRLLGGTRCLPMHCGYKGSREFEPRRRVPRNLLWHIGLWR
jgi:hypothetical protein